MAPTNPQKALVRALQVVEMNALFAGLLIRRSLVRAQVGEPNYRGVSVT